MLNSLLADVFIFTDHVSGAAGGLSPGYGMTLVAETTTKNLISAEGLADVTTKVKIYFNHLPPTLRLLFLNHRRAVLRLWPGQASLSAVRSQMGTMCC